ncbi:MAG: hypothetical protein ACI83W_000398 [Marinoscillum sp.]|jgi:hypothetical protein
MMQKILGVLKEYQSKHFELRLYLTIGLFLIICFIFNYSLDFEDSFVDAQFGSPWHWVKMFFWMMFPFLSVSLILQVFGKTAKLDRGFLIKLIIAFAILATDRTFNAHLVLLDSLPYMENRYFSKSLNWSSSLLFNVLPLIMVYAIFESERPRQWYGLKLIKFDLTPYFILLGFAVLLIGIGSFEADLQAYYPRYQFTMGDKLAAKYEFPEWVSVLFYEVCYGSDFVAVEVFFRGFLIYGFAKWLGGYAVLPMVATYAFLHFGKPLAEAASSVFGGYILGILSYNSRNVWGGIIIHMGVAWAMELFGYLHQLI